MSSPKFKDLSSGSKSLVLIELIFFAGSLLLTVYLNSLFSFVAPQDIPTDLLAICAIVFALVVQLSSLALGLYNSKLRENYRGVLRRLLVSVAIGNPCRCALIKFRFTCNKPHTIYSKRINRGSSDFAERYYGNIQCNKKLFNTVKRNATSITT